MSKMRPVEPLPRANPRIRFLHSWKVLAATSPAGRQRWWSQSGSNRRPQACKASALPTELWPRTVEGEGGLSTSSTSTARLVGREGVEPSTSRLSGVRSNHLSYRPPCLADLKAAGGVSQLRLHFPVKGSVSRMKGHEDGGMFFGQEEECVSSSIRRDP